MMRTGFLLLAFALAAGAADQATIEKGQKEEQRTCLPCHSLRIIHSNRLSRAGWNKELDKMAGWGVEVHGSGRDPGISGGHLRRRQAGHAAGNERGRADETVTPAIVRSC